MTTLHDILRDLVHAMKALDERTRHSLLTKIGEHEAASAVPAPSPAGTALAVPNPNQPQIDVLRAQLAALEGTSDGSA